MSTCIDCEKQALANVNAGEFALAAKTRAWCLNGHGKSDPAPMPRVADEQLAEVDELRGVLCPVLVAWSMARELATWRRFKLSDAERTALNGLRDSASGDALAALEKVLGVKRSEAT